MYKSRLLAIGSVPRIATLTTCRANSSGVIRWYMSYVEGDVTFNNDRTAGAMPTRPFLIKYVFKRNTFKKFNLNRFIYHNITEDYMKDVVRKFLVFSTFAPLLRQRFLHFFFFTHCQHQ